jgi:Protein of unknown function (DUF2723)
VPDRLHALRARFQTLLASNLFFAILVGTTAFAIYLRTLLPDVGGPEDSPKFQYLGAVLGTAHPPGYPLHTMLSHVFSYIPLGTIAYRANLMSATFGAAAVVMAVLVARANGVSRAAAALGALVLAFGVAFWHFSVLAEVYTLAAALLLAIVYWLVRWRHSGRDLHLFAAAGCFALALGNHLSIVAAAPAIALFLLATNARRVLRWRTLAPAALIVASGFLQYAYILIRTREQSRYLEARAETIAELVDVVRARQYQDHVFAFSWDQFVYERLPDFAQLVRDEIGLIGIGLAVVGLIVLFRRDPRVALLLSLMFAGLALFALNLAGDLRGFLVMPLALAPPMIAAGADGVRQMGAKLTGREGLAAVPVIVLFLHPALLLRANFSVNDWSARTEEARFFRALFAHIPSHAALLPEDYLADHTVAYLQGAERGSRARKLLQPSTDPDTVREVFASGVPIFALDARRVELAPRGFYFEPVDLKATLVQAAWREGRRVDGSQSAERRVLQRHAYRLVAPLTTVDIGDGAWHDITAAGSRGAVELLVDNARSFDARVTVYAVGPSPFTPSISTQHRYGRGRPSLESRVFDLLVGQDREAFRQALSADGVADDVLAATLVPADRYVVRVEHEVNDDGLLAAWALQFGGAPRRAIGRAQVDRPHVRRALASALPPD